jgi:hypothetical protein
MSAKNSSENTCKWSTEALHTSPTLHKGNEVRLSCPYSSPPSHEDAWVRAGKVPHIINLDKMEEIDHNFAPAAL